MNTQSASAHVAASATNAFVAVVHVGQSPPCLYSLRLVPLMLPGLPSGRLKVELVRFVYSRMLRHAVLRARRSIGLRVCRGVLLSCLPLGHV